MSKTKTEKTPMEKAGIRPIETREAMIAGVGEFRAATIHKMKLEAKRAKAVQKAEEEFAHDIDEAVVQINGWNQAVEDYCLAHREEFGGHEAIETVHGSVKLYLGAWGTKLLPKFTWDKVIKLVQVFGLENVLLRKFDPEPDKEAMLAYRGEPIQNPKNPKVPLTLEQLGVTCEREEFFKIEPKIETVEAPAAEQKEAA